LSDILIFGKSIFYIDQTQRNQNENQVVSCLSSLRCIIWRHRVFIPNTDSGSFPAAVTSDDLTSPASPGDTIGWVDSGEYPSGWLFEG
jgi:hypothetical protein